MLKTRVDFCEDDTVGAAPQRNAAVYPSLTLFMSVQTFSMLRRASDGIARVDGYAAVWPSQSHATCIAQNRSAQCGCEHPAQHHFLIGRIEVTPDLDDEEGEDEGEEDEDEDQKQERDQGKDERNEKRQGERLPSIFVRLSQRHYFPTAQERKQTYFVAAIPSHEIPSLRTILYESYEVTRRVNVDSQADPARTLPATPFNPNLQLVQPLGGVMGAQLRDILKSSLVSVGTLILSTVDAISRPSSQSALTSRVVTEGAVPFSSCSFAGYHYADGEAALTDTMPVKGSTHSTACVANAMLDGNATAPSQATRLALTVITNIIPYQGCNEGVSEVADTQASLEGASRGESDAWSVIRRLRAGGMLRLAGTVSYCPQTRTNILPCMLAASSQLQAAFAPGLHGAGGRMCQHLRLSQTPISIAALNTVIIEPQTHETWFPETPQNVLANKLVRELARNVLPGNFCSVLVHGPSGSGKGTYLADLALLFQSELNRAAMNRHIQFMNSKDVRTPLFTRVNYVTISLNSIRETAQALRSELRNAPRLTNGSIDVFKKHPEHMSSPTSGGLSALHATYLDPSYSEHVAAVELIWNTQVLPRRPCIVLVNNIHQIFAPTQVADSETAALEAAFLRVFNRFRKDAINQARDNQILFLATTPSTAKVSPSALSSGLFDVVVPITLPSSQHRSLILQRILRPLVPDHDVKNLSLVCEEIAKTYNGGSWPEMLAFVRHATTIAATKARRGVVHREDLEEAYQLLHGHPIGSSKDENKEEEKEPSVPCKQNEASLLVLDQTVLTRPEIQSIVGQARVKIQLIRMLQWLKGHSQFFSDLNLSPPSGALLFGPPGCGKSLIARAVPEAVGFSLFIVQLPNLLRSGVGDSEKSLRDIFHAAKQAAPSVVLIDDIHAAFPRSDVSPTLLAELIVQLDTRQRGEVFVIGTCPSPDLVNDALVLPGRFEAQLRVGLPSTSDRMEILTRAAFENGVDVLLEPENMLQACSITRGMTFADVQGVVRRAVRIAAGRAMLQRGYGKASDRTQPISMEDVQAAIREIMKIHEIIAPKTNTTTMADEDEDDAASETATYCQETAFSDEQEIPESPSLLLRW